MAVRKRSIQRRTRIKSSKLSTAKIGRKIWLLCKEIIRKKYGNECYTCDKKNLQGKQWQTGHMIAKKVCGAYLKYDLRNLRPQCDYCNHPLWGGGMGAEFVKRMIIREGAEYVDQIFRDKSLITKEKEYYPLLLEKYKLMLEEL